MKKFNLRIYLFLASAAIFAGDYTGSPQSNLTKLKETNSCVKCDLSGLDLSSLTLKGANLSGANLSRSRVPAIMQNVNLSGANLHGGFMGHAVLTNVDLSSARLCQAKIEGGRWSGVDLSGTGWIGCMHSCSYDSKDFCKIKNCQKHMERWMQVECY